MFKKIKNLSTFFYLTKVFVNDKNLQSTITLLNKDTIHKDHTLDKLLVLRKLLVL